MAQDFEGKGFPVSTTDVQLRFADSDDAIVGIRLANILTSQVTADVFLQHNGSNIYLVKSAPIPVGGALELIDAGSKVVMMSGDRLMAVCDTANGLDAWVTSVDSIST